jgi:hypothetical protein
LSKRISKQKKLFESEETKMKRILCVLFATFLMSSAFAQQPRPQLDQPLRQRLGADIPIMHADEDRFLFFQLPARAADGPQKVDFIVHEGSRIYVAERFTLDHDAAHPSPSVQFLSREPAQLKKLLRLARKDDRRLKLAVMVNGQIIREFSFAEFLAYNDKLKHDPGFYPVRINPRVSVFRQPKGQDSSPQAQDLTCTQECDVWYEQCAEAACGDPQSICSECYTDWKNCRDSCPPPPPQPCTPSSYTTREAYFVGSYSLPWICSWNYDGSYTWHYGTRFVYQIDTVLHTTCPDGSSVIDTYYDYFDDYYDTGTPC